MAREAGAIFSLKEILLERQYYFHIMICVLSCFVCFSLEPAGCFTAREPGAPLRGGGAFVQVVRGRKWLCTAEGGRKRLVLGWPQLKLPVFPLRGSRELSY